MNHVVLLGDSIFDNEAYVSGGDPVIQQLGSRLPRGCRATLLAVDGAVTGSVTNQLVRIPDDASHLVISAGGNNALLYSGVLASDGSAREAFTELAGIQSEFATDYREMIRAIRSHRKPTMVCTIYDAVPGLEPNAITALSIFNDVIVRTAVENGLPVLDLRLICQEIKDFSSISPIEPSEIGGAKIVLAMLRALQTHDFSRAETVVYR